MKVAEFGFAGKHLLLKIQKAPLGGCRSGAGKFQVSWSG